VGSHPFIFLVLKEERDKRMLFISGDPGGGIFYAHESQTLEWLPHFPPLNGFPSFFATRGLFVLPSGARQDFLGGF